MNPGDAEYYRDRASEERTKAKQATRADVAAIHEQLANEYEALASLGTFPPPLRTESGTSMLQD